MVKQEGDESKKLSDQQILLKFKKICIDNDLISRLRDYVNQSSDHAITLVKIKEKLKFFT